jgi:hypothetical protein
MVTGSKTHSTEGTEILSPFRDFLPHRSPLLIRVGIASVLLGGLSGMPFLGGMAALVGIPVSVGAW